MARKGLKLAEGQEQFPMFLPKSAWTPQAELPDLRQCKTIALDRETKDDGLNQGRGPGWAYGAGRVVGCSVAWAGGAFYAPLGHPDTANLDEQAWARWEKDHIDAGVRFVFQNGPYDLGWGRRAWGLRCPALIDDTTAMAVMVDENRLSYNLDALASWRGLPGKDEAMMREAFAAYGYSGNVKSNIWRMPARFVGPYAEQDAVATLGVYESLLPELEAQGLVDAYRLEMDLVPMVQEMRWRGIRINLDRAQQVKDELLAERDRGLADLSAKLGVTVGMDDMRSARRLAKFFDAEKLGYPRTPKSGEASFDKEWMEGHAHWLPRAVVAARSTDDSANKFIGEYIQGYAHRGRIHASINQWRSDEGGTRSHRFSYSDPPIQQLHELSRQVFEPEIGQTWLKADFASQEVRLMVHFAGLLGCARADEAVERYRVNPRMDYHMMVAEITGLERGEAKAVTFAKAYGAGVKKFALMNGCTEDEARTRIEQYDREMPFVKQLSDRCQQVAQQRGWIRLIDGARCHFDLWEAAGWDDNRDAAGRYMPPRSLEAAKEAWPGKRLKRGFTHKAMNRLIQGSAARAVKRCMKLCWDGGFVPLLQLHDELDFSIADPADADRIRQIMEASVELSIPMVVDIKTGENWGAVA